MAPRGEGPCGIKTLRHTDSTCQEAALWLASAHMSCQSMAVGCVSPCAALAAQSLHQARPSSHKWPHWLWLICLSDACRRLWECQSVARRRCEAHSGGSVLNMGSHSELSKIDLLRLSVVSGDEGLADHPTRRKGILRPFSLLQLGRP